MSDTLTADLLLTPGLMHPPVHVRLAQPLVLGPDDDTDETRAASRRVIDAYQHAAARVASPPAPSLWDQVAVGTRAFADALATRDEAHVHAMLVQLFQSHLIWGLGRVHWQMAADLLSSAETGERTGAGVFLMDALVSLAEATGVLPIACLEQQGQGPALRALDVDPEAVADAIARRTGLDLGAAPVSAAYGGRIGGQLVTIDSLHHACVVWRLGQLGVGPHASVVEIGGGYGALAATAYRNGYRNWSIVDLPWVNALQGYYLLRACGSPVVTLAGERPEGPLRVHPYWMIDATGTGSADLVVNTDSLPEMGSSTARGYVEQIARVLRPGGLFYSLNQEAQAAHAGHGPQNRVHDLVRAHGGYRLLSRQRAWTRQGYLEEVWATV